MSTESEIHDLFEELMPTRSIKRAMAEILDEMKNEVAEIKENRRQALMAIENWAGSDEAHHQQWVLDQVVRALLGKDYDWWVKGMSDVGWDEGIAP